MSNLVLTKNGNIVRSIQPGLGNFPAWTSFIDDLFKEESGYIKNADFNKGITLPKVNIKESVDSYTLEMAVPGFKKSDFVIDLENENLTISADIKTEEEETKEDYTRKEFGYSSFKRTFILPETVEEDKIEAAYTDGILSLNIPKKEEAKPKPARTIKIS
ncbi:Hsp20/alpha crystallin family protein [Lutimonas vermicola]|uniref:Hsp20/alpha crystallin family protein n=1 Tax=Lutimonas vermicola TaxID=414288 RepID=A0ABU9KX27_9FLAO